MLDRGAPAGRDIKVVEISTDLSVTFRVFRNCAELGCPGPTDAPDATECTLAGCVVPAVDGGPPAPACVDEACVGRTCNGRGWCSSGVCLCDPGYTGDACERCNGAWVEEPGSPPEAPRCNPASPSDGTNANDVLVGTEGPDFIRAAGGDDEVSGLGGEDLLSGNEGDDVLFGGPGGDQLGGSVGADELHGGPDDDVLFGGADDDVLFGDEGDDRLVGAGGADVLDGGEGNDRYLRV